MGSSTEELRIAVVFRADVAMPPAKAEVQFGHAVSSLMYRLRGDRILDDYMAGGQLKLSMEVDGMAGLDEVVRKAASRGVPFELVTDAGRTVFGAPTVTCVGLGPMNKTDGNALTRKARMRP